MALASGHWIKKEVLGDAPSPRHGHALTVAGNIAFVFGGCASQGISEDQPIYFNDFHMLTITPGDLTWEAIPQNGHIPCARQGHSLCVVKKNIYLFGGCGSPEAEECIPGMYCFDLGTLMWQKLSTSGIAPRSLKHSSVIVGENIFVFGGIQSGKIADDLYIFNTVSHNWIPVKTTGTAPEARFGHAVSIIGEQMYLFGGCSGEIYYSTVYILDTVTLSWQLCDVKGETPTGRTQHSFTAHHDKDIYLFGGTHDGEDGNKTTRNDVMKLSLAKMKWKMPLYVGVPPAYRYSHTAFVLHSQLFIFGGTNEEKEFNDIMAMRLINPSDRQPIMKEILSEFGIQGVSNGFTPTKVPKVKYELTESPIPARVDSPPPMPASQLRDFRTMRNQAMDKITTAFAVLDSEFEKLDNEKAALLHAKIAFLQEKEAYSKQHRCQQQELLEMVEKHKTQNEAWLKARAEENDKERKEICKLREEILQDQEKLREEQQSVEKRNQQLLLIMQQFKGM